MSPASKSKSKDKKASKEPPKGSLKSCLHISTSNGAVASGYNPLSGTFHTMDSSPIPNIRFRNMDDPDDPNGTEYDSISNNGSWSGESEDHREKPPPPPNPRPEPDNDKREKIRLKNERKHQRQKERRAQELHERCTGYLMSRKLEALSQQLVSMGFPQEQATLALILNEGRVEESVAWLFDGSRQDAPSLCNNGSDGNLKIDIAEELARIAEMEVRYKASKQEVERAIVSCEGDLRRADEILHPHKEEEKPPKPDQVIIGDPLKLQPVNNQNPPVRVQTTAQQRKDEKNFNYTKIPPLGAKNIQVPPKPHKVLAPAEKQRTSASASASVGLHNNNNSINTNGNNSGCNPSTSFSLSSPLLPSSSAAKTEPPRYFAAGNELKNLHPGSVKEPVIVLQRPQQQPITIPNQAQAHPLRTSLGPSPPGLNSDALRPNGIMSSNPMYSQFHYPQQQPNVSNGRGLAAASSLGLFSGVGTNGGMPGSVDWKMGGSLLQCDYANVDWTLDRGLLPRRPNGLLKAGPSYPVQNYDYGGRPVLSAGVPHGLPEGHSSSWEWNSPFEERDIFSLPRQYVSPRFL